MESHSLPLLSWWPGNSFGRVWPTDHKITDIPLPGLTELPFTEFMWYHMSLKSHFLLGNAMEKTEPIEICYKGN